MKIAIIVSDKDPAGLNIRDCLLENFAFKGEDVFDKWPLYKFMDVGLYTTQKESIHYEHIDKEIEADFFIFATRHESKEGVESLTVHCPGNWHKAEFGGEEKKLCVAWANFMKTAFLKLDKNSKHSDFLVSMECTHHGPYLEKPCMFIEIGSSLKHWQNKEAGEIIAKTIMETINAKIPQEKVCIGIGGPHYCNNFNKVLAKKDVAVGHVCPKYQLSNLNKEMLKQAIKRTKEKVDFVLLDWKGLGEEKERIVSILDELGIEYKRTNKL